MDPEGTLRFGVENPSAAQLCVEAVSLRDLSRPGGPSVQSQSLSPISVPGAMWGSGRVGGHWAKPRPQPLLTLGFL